LSFPLARLQTAAAAVAGVCGVAGFLASLDVFLLPPGSAAGAWAGHGLLALLGAVCGVGTVLRGEEIDAKRWAIVEDPLTTKGEAEYAHKDAEGQRRLAGTAFLAAPVFVGYWLLYQLRAEDLVTYLLPGTALAAFGIGVLVANRRTGAPRAGPG